MNLNFYIQSAIQLNSFKTLLIMILLTFITLVQAQEGQLTGVIQDTKGEPLLSATIQAEERGTITDFDGNYRLDLPVGKQTVTVTYVGYQTISKTFDIVEDQIIRWDVILEESATLLQTATVTSGKYEKPLGEATVSLEVLQPTLVESTNTTSVEQVLEKVPGVTIIDGQANIRGGSGYSYGAGSRVLLLVDDIPILQADAGFPNWQDVPVENIAQIEVVKGAASALYGSSALNGIINVRTAYAKSEPVTKISTFYNAFLSPADKSAKWWDKTPAEIGVSVAHRRKIGKLDLVVGGYYQDADSYLEQVYDRFGRFNTNLRYRANDKLTFGVNANYNQGTSQDFFFWAGTDSLLLKPAPNTLSFGDRRRYNIDPFVQYFDEKGNRHKLLGRFYSVNNERNNNQSNSSNLAYGEYQFQRKIEDIDLVATAGLVASVTNVEAELYGDTTFTANNVAAYIQLDKKFFDKLNLSAGFRYENNRINAPTYTYNDGFQNITIAGSDSTEAKPVFRLGANYQLSPVTFLRASWGQGYRYPTIAEKYITTSFSAVRISPNPFLTSETGWSTELGLKQGFKISAFEGFVDVSAFWSAYQDMMEFTFVNIFPTGFQSQNIGNTVIRGTEISIAGRGNLGDVKTMALLGYTYIDPKFKVFDNTIPAIGETPTEGQQNALSSSVDYNILKYRYKHSFKADIQSTWNDFTFGVAGLYNSQMEAIDAVFEQLVVPGLKNFRAENQSGYWVWDARMAYQLTQTTKLSIIGKNLLNETYAIRPGMLGATRSLAGRVDISF